MLMYLLLVVLHYNATSHRSHRQCNDEDQCLDAMTQYAKTGYDVISQFHFLTFLSLCLLGIVPKGAKNQKIKNAKVGGES